MGGSARGSAGGSVGGSVGGFGVDGWVRDGWVGSGFLVLIDAAWLDVWVGGETDVRTGGYVKRTRHLCY